MPVTTYTLQGDFSALVGEVTSLRATIHTNGADQSWVNETDLKVVLGSALLPVAADGTFTVTLPTSTGTGLQYEVRAVYVDNGTRMRGSWTSGWFNLTANGNLATLANDSTLRINPSLGEQLAARIDGVEDHGDVSGPLTLDPANGFHVFDATGPTTVDLGLPPGYSLAFKAITGADQVTVDGLPDLTLTDNAWSTFVYYRGAWDLAASGSGGGGSVEPVTDPPTQPGAVTVTPTNDGYTLSWVASTVAAGYEVQIDGGTWVDSGADTTHTYTGLTAGSEHSGAVRAYNSLGAKSTTRAWGPESVNTVGLHEQILALEPTYYLRTSRGSLESFGAESGWAFTNGTPNFTGPALVTGETGSALISSAAAHLINTNATALNGATALTVVAVVRPDMAEGGRRIFNAYPLAEFQFSSAPVGSYVNEYSRGGQTHTFAATRGAGQVSAQWRDGVAVTVDNQAFTSGSSPQDGDAYIGTWFAGGGGPFYLSHLAVFVNEVLTAETIAALAQAAGTVGNPA